MPSGSELGFTAHLQIMEAVMAVTVTLLRPSGSRMSGCRGVKQLWLGASALQHLLWSLISPYHVSLVMFSPPSHQSYGVLSWQSWDILSLCYARAVMSWQSWNIPSPCITELWCLSPCLQSCDICLPITELWYQSPCITELLSLSLSVCR